MRAEGEVRAPWDAQNFRAPIQRSNLIANLNLRAKLELGDVRRDGKRVTLTSWLQWLNGTQVPINSSIKIYKQV